MRRAAVSVLALILLAGPAVGLSDPASALTVSVASEAEYRSALATLSADGSGPHTITLTADLVLDDHTDPVYSGAPDLLVDGDGYTIDAGGTSRLLSATVDAGQTVTFRDVTLTGGSATTEGGAVRGRSHVRLEGTTVTGNQTGGAGTIAAVDSVGTTGGVVIAVNSTIDGNTAGFAGAAYGGAIVLVHSTVTANSAPQLSTTSVLDTFASVMAEPVGGANCNLGSITSHGYNWSSDASCGLGAAGDTQNGVDAQLLALADNGGPAPTRLPGIGSPLFNAIPTASCSAGVPTDQRGVARPQPAGGNCDIGAVERTPPPTIPVADEAQYRAALGEASGDTAQAHTVLLTADIAVGGSADPVYTGSTDLTVDGDGHVLDAGGTSRLLDVNPSSGTPLVTFRHITVRGGNAAASGGGAVNGGQVRVEDSLFEDNTAFGDGGAISAFTIDVTDSTFRDNTAGFGGGALQNAADGAGVTARNSTFTGNHADGADLSGAGGAIATRALTLDHVTVAGNTADLTIQQLDYDLGALSITNSVIDGSDGPDDGPNCTGGAAVSSQNWADDSTCGLGGTGDTEVPAGDALLGPTRRNGGLTPTAFPLRGSPLRGAIPAADCSSMLTADQRGIARPYPEGESCDIGAVEAVYPPHGFSDVPPWVDTAVRWITTTVNDPRLMVGFGDGTFRPDAPITRGQFVRLLYREAGAPGPYPPHGFIDVPAWLEDAVRWAKVTNVMTGITTTTFVPDESITRAQVARAKYRFAGEQDASGFADHPFTDVPGWVDVAVTWSWHHALMTGITPTTFEPDDPVTRGQVARLDERLGLSPGAWDDPGAAPFTLPFRPDP